MNKVAFLFPGQGAQYVGMGKQIYESYSKVKEIFEEASDCCGIDMAKLCFEGNQETLNQTENTQPAILTVGYATSKILLLEYGYRPLYAAGHSLGEITALTCAGAFEFTDAIKFVKKRGHLMQKAAEGNTGAMSAIIGLEPDVIRQVCEEVSKTDFIVEISNYNSPLQTVISGHEKAVIVVEDRLSKLNAKAIRLSVSAPFHCSLMKPALSQLESELCKMRLNRLQFPVLSNITGAPYIDEQKIKRMLVLQLTQPVEWTRTMKLLHMNSINSVIDIGPGETLKNLASSNIYGIKSISSDIILKRSTNVEESLNTVTDPVNIELIRKCMGIIISSENRTKSQEDYNNYVLNPYKAMKEKHNDYAITGKAVNEDDFSYILSEVVNILKNKGLNEQDYKSRMIELMPELQSGSHYKLL